MSLETFEGFNIYHYKEVVSTNTEALDLISKGISDEIVVIADKQTGGKGRAGKTWLSPEGNLYASLIINQVQRLTEFTFISALAVGNTLLSLISNINLQYKWPNDVLIDSQKISGILLERQFNSSFLVIGIGINIVYAPLPNSTCISNYGISISNMDLLKRLIINFNRLRQMWLSGGFCVIKELWLQRAFKLNEQVSIKFSDKLYKGVFTDINECGKLVLQKKNKSLVCFNAGSIL
ncbi:MAG: biotin--[acetyl-CoA-carboxylase] ligase [Wolbachia endosymbiont of Tyrophagus putrescentiae]|nr:biotin--[acetyl-CoA-carboxylase] ligase [Wolbachia endosymbiont of Tyrophagus putrescentiae]